MQWAGDKVVTGPLHKYYTCFRRIHIGNIYIKI